MKRWWLVGVSALLAACEKGNGMGPQLPPCTSGGAQIILGLAAYQSVDPGPISGCTVFPANGSGSPIEYLLVPQAATGTPNDSQAFRLSGAAVAEIGRAHV